MSMTDRELIELAAKAIGAKEWPPAWKGDHAKFTAEGFSGWFDPLGWRDQTFTLAIRLGIVIDPSDLATLGAAYVSYPLYGSYHILTNMEVKDAEKDIQRLVVRAAAEIGKAMQEKK